MKLVDNGTMGVLVDTDVVETLNTPEAIDNEINRITLGDYDVVVRDNNNVVDPQEYVDYLEQRKQSITTNSVSSEALDEPIHESITEDAVEATEAVSDNEIELLKVQLERQQSVIKRLLTVAKRAQADDESAHELLDDNAFQQVVYVHDIPEADKLGSVSVKGPLREIIHELSGDNAISVIGNAAMARGILGDARAKELIDDLYHEGQYQEFLDSLGG